MTDFDHAELLAVFLAESEENLATLEQLLVSLESSRDGKFSTRFSAPRTPSREIQQL